jgi:SpoIID/LytB domain protein
MKNDCAPFRRRQHPQISRRRSHVLRAAGLLAAAAIVSLVFAAGHPLMSSAEASTSFVFAGRGNGHGAGMSQWGAWQGAREGNSYAQILAFYYPGTTLEQTADADEILKVRVSSKPWTSNTTNFSQVDVEPTVAPATLRLYTSNSNYTTLDVPLGSAVRSVNAGGKVKVTADGEAQGSFTMMELVPGGSGSSEGRVEITLKTSGGTSIDPREYWGTIRVQFGDDAGELWVYNFVPLEKYVRSIAEVDYDWATVGGDYYAPDAVKAQAVASRTYAVAKNGATLSDNWADQCYRGYSFEAKYPGIAQAAQATAGQILTYAGEPVTAYFSGHSGGYTSTSAWSGAKPPYIVSQADPWSLRAPPSVVGKGPGWAWTYTITADNLSDKVNGSLKDISGKTVNVGTISDVQVVARDTADATSHATRLRLAGSNGSVTVSVLSFRSLIGTSNLPSTLILTINGDTGAGTTVGDPGGDQAEDGGSGGAGPGSSGGTPLMPGEFYDVGTSHLYHDEISRVVTAELMGGYENGLFRPEGTVSRAQFAKIAVSLYNLLHVGDQIAVVNVTAKPFDDVAIDSKKVGDISDWIAAAKDAGLISGTSATSFSPYDDVQRDQMATMLCRALGWQDEAEALSADTPGFADVAATSPHWAAAAYLRQKGVLLGYGDSDDGSAVMLGAGEAIKRQHVAVILCRVLDLPR